MNVRIIAVGRRQPGWVESGFEEYAKRLPRHLHFELVEIPPERRDGRADVARLKAREADRIRSVLQPGERVIALDEKGRSVSTKALAASLEQWQQDGLSVALLIGGADGLAPELLADADQVWSLSGLTLPHGMVRVVLTEALYRAWSLSQNHPYHRE